MLVPGAQTRPRPGGCRAGDVGVKLGVSVVIPGPRPPLPPLTLGSWPSSRAESGPTGVSPERVRCCTLAAASRPKTAKQTERHRAGHRPRWRKAPSCPFFSKTPGLQLPPRVRAVAKFPQTLSKLTRSRGPFPVDAGRPASMLLSSTCCRPSILKPRPLGLHVRTRSQRPEGNGGPTSAENLTREAPRPGAGELSFHPGQACGELVRASVKSLFPKDSVQPGGEGQKPAPPHAPDPQPRGDLGRAGPQCTRGERRTRP